MKLSWLESIPFMTGLDASYVPVINKQLRNQFFDLFGMHIPTSNCCLNHNERIITTEGDISYLQTKLIIGIYGFPCMIGWKFLTQLDQTGNQVESIECWWEKFYREQILADHLRRRLERKKKLAADPFLKQLQYKATLDPAIGLDVVLRFQSNASDAAEIASILGHSAERWNSLTLAGQDQGLIHYVGELKKEGKYYTVHIDLGSATKGGLEQLLLDLNAKSSLIKKLQVL